MRVSLTLPVTLVDFLFLHVATGCKVGEQVMARWPEDGSWKEAYVREVFPGGDCGIYRIQWVHSDICTDSSSSTWGDATALQSKRCKMSKSSLRGGSCASVKCGKQGFGDDAAEEEEEGMPIYLLVIIIVVGAVAACFCLWLLVQCVAKDGEDDEEAAKTPGTAKSAQGLWSMKTAKSLGDLSKVGGGIKKTLTRSLSFKGKKKYSKSDAQKVAPGDIEKDEGDGENGHHHHHKKHSHHSLAGDEHHHYPDAIEEKGNHHHHHHRHSSSRQSLGASEGHHPNEVEEKGDHHHHRGSEASGAGRESKVQRQSSRKSNAGRQSSMAQDTLAIGHKGSQESLGGQKMEVGHRSSNASLGGDHHHHHHHRSGSQSGSLSDHHDHHRSGSHGPRPSSDATSPGQPQTDISNGHGEGKNRHSHRHH